MKYLGIDYGKKRVGVALSDDNGSVAFPHKVFDNTPVLLEEIGALLREHQIGTVVFGYSKNLNGEDNPIQRDIEAFAKALVDLSGIEVKMEEEFFSTKAAAAATKEKDEKDAAAAAVILNYFLQKHQTEDKEKNDEVDYISYDDFAKLEIRIGTILEVDVVEKADKLLKLQVDFGDHTRQIVSGIREFFSDPQSLVGKQCPFITNLQPRTIRGETSNGMILAAQDDQHLALLHPHIVLASGTKVN